MSARDSDLESDLLRVDAVADEPQRPDPALRAKLLGTIGSDPSRSGFTERLARFFDLGRERASELLREASGDARGWEAPPLAGVRLFHLAGGPRVAQADCGLVRIEAGGSFPQHRHGGGEWTFVLAGEAEEEGSGVRWAPGDLVHRPAGSVHAFRVTSRGPFVFAVVLDGGIELAAS